MAIAAAGIFGAMFLLWLLSLKLKDSSIVDIFWGCGFVGVGWLSWWVQPSDRALLAAALTTLWGGRLSLHLFQRNHGKPEDQRYEAMRAKRGASWWIWSLLIVFGLQGALMWVVSLPLQTVRAGPLGVLDFVSAAVVLAGVAFEAVGDAQLKAFKRDHPGQVMTTGLWSWSRHPNYFGDFLVWCGLFGFGAWWAIIGPIVMAVLLRFVSGVPMLERTMGKKPGWDAYAARTSAFFPLPPKKA